VLNNGDCSAIKFTVRHIFVVPIHWAVRRAGFGHGSAAFPPARHSPRFRRFNTIEAPMDGGGDRAAAG
jgi:hypothetical protein